VPAFRYAQYCPVARAAEVLGERWTLPLLRDLFIGPQRFSDLRRRLPGLSSSVLATRLARLEELGVVERRVLEPPAASTVYALTATGHALEPALRELMRWGLRLMGPPRPGDHIEPEWVPLTLRVFARPGATPPRSFEIEISEGSSRARVRVAGGPGGTRVGPVGEPADVRLCAPPLLALGLASGLADGATALREGRIGLEGDPAALRDLPALFAFDFPEGSADREGAPGIQPHNPTERSIA
jgi:DNA-binding HxlR family transcriptional regulator